MAEKTEARMQGESFSKLGHVFYPKPQGEKLGKPGISAIF